MGLPLPGPSIRLRMTAPAFLLWLAFLSTGLGAYDLYLPSHEVRTLLGLSRQMYYVRAGDVKRNALDFVIPISEDVNKLHFTWASPERRVNYDIKISTSDPDALRQPHLNVSHSGVIPAAETTWRVTLPCTRTKHADVLVTIDIRLRGFDAAQPEKTHDLKISRKKICKAEGDARTSSSTSGATTAGDGVRVSKTVSSDSPPPHVVFVCILLAALVLVVLIVVCVVAIHVKARKSLAFAAEEEQRLNVGCGGDDGADMAANAVVKPVVAKPVLPDIAFGQPYDGFGRQPEALPAPPSHLMGVQIQHRPGSRMSSNSGIVVPPPPPLNPPPDHLPSMMAAASGSGGVGGIMSDAESRVSDWVQRQQQQIQPRAECHPMAIMKMLEVDRLRLKLGQLHQEGTFGRMYQCTLLNDDDQEEDVLVKTVVAGTAETQSELLILEATSLQGLVHHHVQTLLASTWDGSSPMLVYPYTKYGNLKRWLLSNGQAGLSTHVVVSLGLQMLKALQHLHKRKMVHRDVAARNCFLGDGHVLKLCDSALSRDLFPGDYHCLGDNENRPIKWMPVESISQKKFSRASDVWSFGVFLWELMTRAQQPFSDIDPFEMEGYLLEGFRLHQPLNCPDQLYSVLASCWGTRATERLGVSALYNHLQNLQKQLQQFV